MNVKQTLRATLAGVLLLSAAMQGCKKKAADDEDAGGDEKPTVTVQAEKIAVGSITETIQADTVLQPLAQSAVVPKISSPVRRFYVQRGAHVRAGQVLAVLENADLAAAVTDTRGSLTQAEATYNTTAKATVVEDMQQAQSNVAQTKSALDVQRQQTDSRANLLAQGAIPRRDYDTARAALAQAQAAYDTAAQHLASLQRVSQRATVENARGGLTSARGKYEEAQSTLGYATVRSPINGVVTDRPLFPGEMAQAGQPLLTVMDTSSVLAKVHLTMEQVAELHLGDKAQITGQGVDASADGAVSLISPAADAGSTTIEVWVKVPNRDAQLKPGTPVHVTIATRTLNNITTAPAESVITTKTGDSALMVIGTDGIAHQRVVKLGVTDGKDTQVITGAHAGEMVVTTGARSLEDGTKVKVGPAEDDAGGGDKADSADKDAGDAAGGGDKSAPDAADKGDAAAKAAGGGQSDAGGKSSAQDNSGKQGAKSGRNAGGKSSGARGAGSGSAAGGAAGTGSGGGEK